MNIFSIAYENFIVKQIDLGLMVNYYHKNSSQFITFCKVKTKSRNGKRYLFLTSNQLGNSDHMSVRMVHS